MNNMKKIKLKVNGIHCNGCATKIKNSIATLGIEHVLNVNVESGQVEVSYQADKSSLGEIKSKITDVGFQVESVEVE